MELPLRCSLHIASRKAFLLRDSEYPRHHGTTRSTSSLISSHPIWFLFTTMLHIVEIIPNTFKVKANQYFFAGKLQWLNASPDYPWSEKCVSAALFCKLGDVHASVMVQVPWSARMHNYWCNLPFLWYGSKFQKLDLVFNRHWIDLLTWWLSTKLEWALVFF